MSSSPLQFVNARTQPHPPLPSLLLDCHELRRPISPTLGQQRPGDPCHLVGQRDRDDLERSPSEKLSEPGIFLRLLARTSQDRMGSDNQNTPEILVALFRDRPELRFAAGRILPRHDPDPGRKITTRPECLRVGDDGRDGGRAYDADTGDGLEPLARLVRAMLRNDPFLDRSDQRLDRLKLRRQNQSAPPAAAPWQRFLRWRRAE